MKDHLHEAIFVPHQALLTSSSRKPSREVRMPRNTRENLSIPRTLLIFNLHDEYLSDDIMTQIWLYHRRCWEQKEVRKVGRRTMQQILLLCFFNKSKEVKSLDDKMSHSMWPTMPWVLGLVLRAWQFWVDPTRRRICKIPWPNGISRSLLECEEFHTRLVVDLGNRIDQLAEGSHQSKINYGQRFLCFGVLDFMMATELKWCDKTKNSYTERKTE